MTGFQEIEQAATARIGGAEALRSRLPEPKAAEALRAVGDDRYLSLMSRRIFRAGLKHAMVDARWPAFEQALLGFEPRRVRAFHDEDLDRLLADKRLIRHGGKMRAVLLNAAALCDLAEECGSFGAYLADWPTDDVVGLWHDLARRFSQLGGNSGPMFLRMAGKDSFILTADVGRALVHWGATERPPKGKRDQFRAQTAFNAWADESGRPLCQVSMILALSVE